MPSKRLTEKKELTAEERKAKMVEERAFMQKLMESALKGDSDTVEKMASEYSTNNNVSLFQVYKDIRDGSKRTALHFACSSPPGENKDDIVSNLLTKSNFQQSEIESLIMTEDEDGLTPLMMVCNQLNEKSLERIECILRLGGPKVTLSKSKAGAMALHYAAGSGASRDIVKLLYENGKESIASLTAAVGSPLHWASGVSPPNNYTDTIKELLDGCGSDVNIVNERGITPLILAAASGNDAHAKILVESGADRGFILGGNMNVFHIAAELNLVETLHALLNTKESDTLKETTSKCLQMKSDRGETPLDLASMGGHIGCVKLISGISNDDEVKALMENTRDKVIKKREDEKMKSSESSTNESGDASPQEAAANILANKSSITEENKKIAAELKQKGNAFYVKKEWEAAITYYSEAIKNNPADETIYSNRSACHMAMKNYTEALYDAIVAHTLKKDWIKGCYRVSVALLALQRYEDAAVIAFEGLSLDQNNDEMKSLFQKCIKKGRKEHEEKNNEKENDSKLKKQTFFGST